MHRLILFVALLGACSPSAASDDVPFEPSADRFSDAAACTARLAVFVRDARARQHVAVNGPYQIAPGDIRVHSVVVAGSGHRITEQRCLGAELSSRTWRHSISEAQDEASETIESMAAKAEWLKKPQPK